MITIDINTFHNFSIRLILSICIAFFLFGMSENCQAQDAGLKMKFVKNNDSIEASELYFNVLKIYNNTAKPIRGEVIFTAPENWKTISFSQNLVTINPGDSASVPVRVSPDANAAGGIAYLLNALLKTDSRQISTNTYLVIPAKSKWEFATNSSSLYFTEYSPNAQFQVKLSNKGNTNELVKLHLKIGKLLVFLNSSTDDYTEFVNLKAYKDTIVTYTVAYQKALSYIDKIRFENNWKESAIMATASTEKAQKSAAIMIHKLNSTFVNERVQNSSPLNIDYQTYNLMSSQPIRSNLKMYGTVLFPKNREIQYVAGLQNIYYGNTTEKFNVDQQLLYSVKYLDKKNDIELGYNISGGNLHAINGRGIAGSFKFNNQNMVSYALIQNPYSRSYGEYLGYDFAIKNITFNTGVTHENSMSGDYDANSILIGTGFTLFKHHTLSLQLLGSQSHFTQVVSNDTTVRGYSYKIDYNVRYKKFDMRISGMSSLNNYIRNSGLQQVYADGKYMLTDKVTFSLYGNHQYYSATRFPYNFYNPTSYNSTDYAKFTTSISAGKLTYQLGPNYIGSMRQIFNGVTNYKSEYITYQPGFWAAMTIKMDGYRSITPNATISNLRFYYNTEDPAGKNYSSDKNLYYSVGLNYFDPNWRVNAYYSSGSTSDLYRSIQVDKDPVVSRSIQLRPSYENYFFNRTVRLSAYVNYIYYMPSGRENTSFNIKYDQFFKKGWILSVSGFMYSNVRVDKEFGRVGTKDLNFVIGVSKSFNIQQPRLKYYDFKAVFFNDLDGNRIKTNNEPPVPNVLVNIEKDRAVSTDKSNIPALELLADLNGEVGVENLPKDNYKMKFTPLTNLENLYFVNGSEQDYYNDKSRILYVPLAESYKIKGKIILVRDPNSSEGKIDLNGIRITATGMKGETYSTLTDSYGAFVLSVPNADKYTVHVNNVFGEQFSIDSNEELVQFAQNKTINLDFTFMERRREILFDNGTDGSVFNSFKTNTETVEPVQTDQTVSENANSKSYAIQLAAVKGYRDPSYYKKKFKLKDEVLYSEKDGVYRYYTGDYSSLQAARAAQNKSALSGQIVEVDRAQLMEATPVEAIQPARQSTEQIVERMPVADNKPMEAGVIKSANSTPVVSSSHEEIAHQSESVETISARPIAAQPKGKKASATTAKSSNKQTPAQNNQEAQAVTQPSTVPVSAVRPIAEQPEQNAESVTPTKSAEEKPMHGVTGEPKRKQGNVKSTAKSADTKTTLPEQKNEEGVVSAQQEVSAPVNSANPVVKTAPVAEQKQEISTERLTSESAKSKQVKSASKKVVSQKAASQSESVVSTAPFEIIDGQVVMHSGAKTTESVRPATAISKPTNSTQTQAVSTDNDTNKRYLYTIRLDASANFSNASYYKEKYKLPFDVICVEKGDERNFYVGKYVSEEAARADIARYGLAGFIVPVEESGMK